MMKTKRSVVTTIILLLVVGLVYSISSSSNSLGDNKPINLSKDDFKSQIEIGKGYSEESILDGDHEISTDDHQEMVVDNHAKGSKQPLAKALSDATKEKPDDEDDIPHKQDLTVSGVDVAFMPKMANETLKAQLGNSAWRLFHTILARYPDEPTDAQQSTLNQYIMLFAQVYPCGDCARHFQTLLQKYPPQTKSRKTAALWGCHVHNKVNERLGKDEYDCTKILEDYDCGCGNDEQEVDITLGGKSINNLKDVKIEEEDQQLG